MLRNTEVRVFRNSGKCGRINGTGNCDLPLAVIRGRARMATETPLNLTGQT